MTSILTKLFGKPEEINGGNRCPTYLYRWIVMRTPWFKAYLHHFVGDDWSLDLHDHPKRFISIGLWGWYMEERPCRYCLAGDRTDDGRCPGTEYERYDAPWIRTFPAQHIHRLTVPSKNCWTLVIVGNVSREWGFWHRGAFIHWKEYVFTRGGAADKMKACD